MTTQVSIKNIGGSHTVSARKVSTLENGDIHVEDAFTLEPFDSVNIYLWGTQKIVIEEKPLDENHPA